VFAGKDSMCGRGLILAETEDVCGRRNVFWGRIRCMTIECKFSNNEKMQKRRPMSRRCFLGKDSVWGPGETGVCGEGFDVWAGLKLG
jgi:hypothetical protein